jgi:tetratricopeptide (TPR) repeat protein
MRCRSIALLVLTGLLVVPARASDWDRSVSLYNKGDYRAALAEFQDIVMERPEVAGAWYYIGLCEFKLKRFERVELPMSHAIELLGVQTPDSADIAGAWYAIGLAHYLLGKYEKTVDPLKRYLELTAKASREIDPSARTALARSLYFLERYDEAAPYLAGAVSEKPSPAAPDKAAERLKEQAANNYYLGAIYFRREDDDRAIPALRESAAANGADPATLELLTESLMRKARKLASGNQTKDAANSLWSEATVAAEKLRAIRDDLKTANLLGRAYLGAVQFDKAAPHLEKFARANTDNGQAWLLYGVALSRSGQMRKAMEALEITIQLVPDSVPAHAELGYVYESDKQYQQALRVYQKAYAATSDPSIKESLDRVKALAATQQP